MGALGGMFGLSGGAAGTGFGGPGGSSEGVNPIMNAVSQGTVDQANALTQNSLASQQDLLAALQAQNGFGNQNQIFGQLQGIANGTGPNPAQAQFKNNANQIAAQTAGMIGSQKGMSPALQARLIAQQGAGAQQAMAGQNAAVLAQQQLGALGAAGNMANQMAGNQIAQTNQNAASRQAQQGMLLNAITGQNSANAGLQANINSNNAALAGKTMDMQKDTIGGLMKGASAAAGMPMAHGGAVPDGPASSFGRYMKNGGAIPGKAPYAGDDPRNDIVDIKASPGEFILTREVMQSKNPGEAAKKFVNAYLAKKGKK